MSSTKTGVPALSNVYAGHLAMWLKDLALNRIWHIHIPRYTWNKSMSWLNSQSESGSISGSAAFSRSGFGGSGGTNGDYCDWKNHIIHINGFNLSISLDSGPKEMKFSGDIDTPYYDVSFSLAICVFGFFPFSLIIF